MALVAHGPPGDEKAWEDCWWILKMCLKQNRCLYCIASSENIYWYDVWCTRRMISYFVHLINPSAMNGNNDMKYQWRCMNISPNVLLFQHISTNAVQSESCIPFVRKVHTQARDFSHCWIGTYCTPSQHLSLRPSINYLVHGWGNGLIYRVHEAHLHTSQYNPPLSRLNQLLLPETLRHSKSCGSRLVKPRL